MAGFDESELLVCRGDSGPGLDSLFTDKDVGKAIGLAVSFAGLELWRKLSSEQKEQLLEAAWMVLQVEKVMADETAKAVLDLLERISRHEKVDPSEIRAGISAIRSAIGGGL